MAVNLIDSNDIKITQTGSDITLDQKVKNTYSTSEVVCGAWNNKPLYRKIVNLGSLASSATTTEYDLGLPFSSTTIRSLQITAQSPTAFVCLPFTNSGTQVQELEFFVGSSGKLTIRTFSDRSAYSGTAIVEYTKTTD